MKTKSFFLSFVLIAMSVFISCKKSDKQSTNIDTLVALNATWVNSAYGGVNSNPIKISINSSTGVGTVTSVGSQNFGIAVGDQFFTNITAGSSGTYNAIGEYTYGSSFQKGTRPVVLSLQNNNTQLTADYPAINASFPEIIYIFQKQ